VERLFKVSSRVARDLLFRWSQEGFLTVADSAKKGRRYGLFFPLRGLAALFPPSFRKRNTGEKPPSLEAAKDTGAAARE